MGAPREGKTPGGMPDPQDGTELSVHNCTGRFGQVLPDRGHEVDLGRRASPSLAARGTSFRNLARPLEASWSLGERATPMLIVSSARLCKADILSTSAHDTPQLRASCGGKSSAWDIVV